MTIPYVIPLTPLSKRVLRCVRDIHRKNAAASHYINEQKVGVHSGGVSRVCKTLDISLESFRYHVREHLYGLVGVVMDKFDWQTVSGKKLLCIKHTGYYIPPHIADSVDECLSSRKKIFSGEISETSLPVLRYIVETTCELKAEKGNWRNYPFHRNEIANRTCMNADDVSEALKDLTGIIVDGVTVMHNYRQHRQRVFLPRARQGLAEYLLNSV